MSEHLYDGEFYWLSPESFSLDLHWWKIYEESFPLAERDSKEQLKFAIKKNVACIGGYRIGEEIVAIVVLYRMQKPAFAFLHFFAVAAAWRGKQLGSQLFKLIVAEAKQYVLQQSDKTLGLVWEVEDPTAAQNPKDQLMQSKRIHFYERLGGELFQSKFIQPPLNNQQAVAMQLMHNFGRSEVAELDIATAIYYEKYQNINDIESQQIEEFLNRCYPKLKAG